MAREIWVYGFPSLYGGADTELDHLIDLWRRHDVGVTLVTDGPPDALMLRSVLARGCKVRGYRPAIFKDRILLSLCNGEFLRRLPEIHSAGKPALTLWANCMTWTFPAEVEAHRQGLIDLHLFQSRYQEGMLRPSLEAFHPVQSLEGYCPWFNADRLPFRPLPVIDHFAMGRISRDDAAKFPADMWRTFAKVSSPVPTRALVLGYGPNARSKCGNPPDWLDWQTWEPGAIPAADLYRRLHCLIHRTGGSRENWPRTVIEAMAAGVPVIAERDYGLPEMIEDGVTGFLCGSSDEMSFRASELAFNESGRLAMARAANMRFLSEHASPARSMACWNRLFGLDLPTPPAPAKPQPLAKPPQRTAEQYAEDFPCSHRSGPPVPAKCKLCGSKDRDTLVWGCDLHGRCTVEAAGLTLDDHKRMRVCVACEDRSDTPAK